MAEEDAKLDAEEESGTQDPPKPKKKKEGPDLRSWCARLDGHLRRHGDPTYGVLRSNLVFLQRQRTKV